MKAIRSISFEKAKYLYRCLYYDKYHMTNVAEPEVEWSYQDAKGGWYLRDYDSNKLAHVLKSGYVKLNQ
jgi:hypothetical protein